MTERSDAERVPGQIVPEIPQNAEPRTGLSMGEHAAKTALEWGITREEQDELAVASHVHMAAAYVAVCLAYGSGLTQVHDNRWLMSVLLAIGFTSTLLHYYFDGFIWKVRHAQNRENLGLDAGSAQSWGTPARMPGPTAVLARQLSYFGIPMGLLTAGMLAAAAAPSH